jgi:spore germination protein YaaH
VRIVQADPPPSTGLSHAFLLASTDESFAAFREHYRKVGTVYPTFFDCDRATGSGLVTGNDNAQIVQFAKDRKVRVLPRFNCQGATVMHRILTEPALRTHWLDTITRLTVERGYDGASVDFEAVPAADRNLLTSFIAELSDRLHAQGKILAQAVSPKTKDDPAHPRSGAFDYPELAKYDDIVFVMAWGLHWATSAPGPQDDLAWVRAIADHVATMPLKQKFVLGSQLYAMDWPNGGGAANEATAHNIPQLREVIARTGATPAYDAASDSWRLDYTDAAGVPHQAWWTDISGVANRMALARERGLGTGFWRLGQEDPLLWTDPRVLLEG